MNARRDPDRLIHAFLMEGQTELADQVYDAVRATIEQKRQRVVFGPWRTPIMNKFVPIGVGAAAVVVALVIGAQLLGPAPGGVGAGPSAEQSPTASPTPSVSPSPTPVPEGLLPAGSHVLWDAESSPESPEEPGGLLTTVTIPGPGWYGEPAGGIITREDNPDPPAGAGMIGPWFRQLYVFGDPCAWSTTTPDAPATTVDELMAALAAQALRDASAPVDITLDGHAGKSITLHVPDDADFSRCDQGTFGSWTVGPNLEPYRYHQGPGQIDEIWAVDVDGELVVVDWAYYEGTPQSVIDELRSIVESIRFE
jgi:hypothetical protein